jgi:hypothetical protein
MRHVSPWALPPWWGLMHVLSHHGAMPEVAMGHV